MRWYALISLISDSRVQFLLWSVVVAFILAGVLALIEFRLKRERERRAMQNVNELAIEKIWRFLRSDKTLREKLDFIDKTAKTYFKETYGTSLNSSYSVLTEEFEKMRRNNEIVFCKTMFATYYLNKELTESEVIALGNLLISIEKNKESVNKVPQVPSFMERVNWFFEKRKWAVSKRKIVREEKGHLKVLRRGGVKYKREMLKVERDAHKRKTRVEGRRRIREKILSIMNQINQFFEERKRIALNKKLIREKERRELAGRREGLDIIARRNKKRLLAIKEEEAQKLKIAKLRIVGIKKKHRGEKIRTYKEDVGRVVRGMISKLGVLFGVGKIWKNKIFTEDEIIKKSAEKVSPQGYTEIVKKGVDENIKEKLLDSVRVHKGKEAVSLKKNSFFDYNYGGYKNLQNAGRESLQKQTVDFGESGNSIEMGREGIAERIIRKEKERLKDRGIFAVEI
ncbi:MAG: hypothetical protein ABIF18_02610 [archaeon]